MLEWFAVIGLIVGVLAAFRCLYKAVSRETIGWWDAASFVSSGPVIARILRMATARVDALPDWTPRVAAPLLSVAVMYWMLRAWKELSRGEAIIISISWLPIILITVVIFILTNPALFG